MIQGSEEWRSARLGKVTASRISDVMAGGKGVTRAKYMAELVAELCTGEAASFYSSPEMVWGTETEAQARAFYSLNNITEVTECGFVPHPFVEMAGASPDGLIGNDGLIEIKCPKSTTHVSFLETKKIPSRYVYQMQWQLACTERKWCDFMSFDPRMEDDGLKSFVVRVERDESAITAITSAVQEFLSEMEVRINSIKGSAE